MAGTEIQKKEAGSEAISTPMAWELIVPKKTEEVGI
jgi:hypothetical protein